MLAYTGGKFEVNVVKCTNNSTSVILHDPEVVKEVFEYCDENEEFCLDSTFKVLPKELKPRQLMVLQIFKANYVSNFKFF